MQLCRCTTLVEKQCVQMYGHAKIAHSGEWHTEQIIAHKFERIHQTVITIGIHKIALIVTLLTTLLRNTSRPNLNRKL